MKTERAATARQLEQLGIVAVIRVKDPEKVRGVVEALAAGGVRALEVTMTVPRAVDLIRELAPTMPEGFLLGAGTVTDARTARAVIEAGASFVVGPTFRPDVIAACHESEVPVVPGCFSPTEILAAHDAGADIIKLFPATALGPQYVKDVLAPLPHIKLMPTGGVTIENAGDWIRAGAVAVGLGSALLDTAAIESGRLEVIRSNAERAVASVTAARR